MEVNHRAENYPTIIGQAYAWREITAVEFPVTIHLSPVVNFTKPERLNRLKGSSARSLGNATKGFLQRGEFPNTQTACPRELSGASTNSLFQFTAPHVEN